MKKIMFNDKYGLTQAVLQGRKTMTRRMAKDGTPLGNWRETEKYAKYKIGEVVAVAQSYETLADSGTQQLGKMMENPSTIKKEYCGAGWNNKMFVKPDLMPHQIRIIDVKIEKLQEISDEDCLKEGIRKWGFMAYHWVTIKSLCDKSYRTPRDAFAALINKVSGTGTWESNPWVFAYSFELVK